MGTMVVFRSTKDVDILDFEAAKSSCRYAKVCALPEVNYKINDKLKQMVNKIASLRGVGTIESIGI